MAKFPYRQLGISLDRNFRNNLNANLVDIEADIKELGAGAQTALDAADEASTQALYAQEQGDYANTEGTYASEQGDYAKAQGDVASTSATNANDKAAYATTQGDYAKQVANDNKTRFLSAVATVTERNSTYPTPLHGDTVRVTGESKTYRFVQGSGWVVTDVYNPTAIDEVNAQLAETSTKVDNPAVVGEALVSFVFDDGWIQDYTKVRPIFQTKGIKGVVALISSVVRQNKDSNINANYMNLSQINELIADGWEMTSHTVNHYDFGQLSLEQAEIEMKDSKSELTSFGINVESIVYPIGGVANFNNDTLKLARKYYRSAVSTIKGLNKSPIDQYAIKRTGIGDYDYITDYQARLDMFKQQIDKAYAEKSWVMYMLHGGIDFLGDSADKTQLMSDIIDYTKLKGIRIVTLSEGLDIKENLINIGNYNKGHFMVSKEGGIKSDTLDKMPTIIKDKTGMTINTPVTEFELNKISVCSFLTADNSGFPGHQAGTLFTYRLYENYDDLSYQLWYPFNSDTVYKRRWDKTNKVWTAFNLITSLQLIKTGKNNGTTSTTSVTSFSQGVYHIYTFETGQGTGFPFHEAGTLITWRDSSNDALSWQEWRPFNSDVFYKRRWDNIAKVWLAFTQVYPISKVNVTPPTVEVSAGAYYSVEVDCPGIKNTHAITATPQFGISSDVVYGAFCSNNEKVVIWIKNHRASTVSFNRTWTITFQ